MSKTHPVALLSHKRRPPKLTTLLNAVLRQRRWLAAHPEATQADYDKLARLERNLKRRG